MMQWTFLKEPFKRSTLKIEAVKMFLKDKITYSKHQPPKVGSRELNNFNSYMKVCFRKMHQKLPLLELSVTSHFRSRWKKFPQKLFQLSKHKNNAAFYLSKNGLIKGKYDQNKIQYFFFLIKIWDSLHARLNSHWIAYLAFPSSS